MSWPLFTLVGAKWLQLCLILCDPKDYKVLGFSRPQYWSGEPFPSPGDLPYPEIGPGLPHCRQILYQLSYQGNPFAPHLEKSAANVLA